MNKLLVLVFVLLLSCKGGDNSPKNSSKSPPPSPSPPLTFAIASHLDIVNGIDNAGSVMLINAATGAQIGPKIAGDNLNDSLGRTSITPLGNGNFVINSTFDDVAGVNNSGSVMIINGSTGAQVGPTIAGDSSNNRIGDPGVVSLGNGNFVIPTKSITVGGVAGSGSVMLINGSTGAQIGSTISGDDVGDRISSSGVTALENGNFVISSLNDDVGGITNAGSVMIINGSTGVQIGATISGDNADDYLGNAGVTSLGNGNFVISSLFDDVGGITDAGSVMIIDGSTGTQVGVTLSGNSDNDRLGSSITPLGNGNFVIASEFDDVGGVSNAGSVMIIDGSTGAQIGATLSGDNTEDKLGNSSITSLGNGNFVIASGLDDVGGVSNAGSVMIIDGSTGAQIGSTISGDNFNDRIGGSSITPIGNGNFVIASELDDVGGIADAGSVMVIDGSTGAQIGSALSGDSVSDKIGSSSITHIGNGNFVIASEYDDVGGISNAGSVMVINGSTMAQIGSTISGDDADDRIGASSITSLENGNFVIASEHDDVAGISNAGSVMIINGSTTEQIGTTISGDDADDQIGISSVTLLK